MGPPPSVAPLPGGAGPEGPERGPLTAKDLGVVAYGIDPAPRLPGQGESVEPARDNPTEHVKAVASWGSRRMDGAKSTLATGWKSFADTMDKIFDAGEGPPGAADGLGAPPLPSEKLQETDLPLAHGQAPMPGQAPMQGQAPMPGQAPWADMAAGPQPAGAGPWSAPPVPPCFAPQDVPMLFRTPTVEETRELLEQEGLPAYVALGGHRGFVPKRLCLDSSGRNLYALEADSAVPSVFFGISGFGLKDLRRIVHGPLGHPHAKPLLSLEFEEGFLPVRLGDASVLRALVALLASLGEAEVVECNDWA